ncbi:hypothetical protein MMSR116_11060 [Methylobacterium mesophilicum SR1.6/6]|uniref:Uncharacterized protein n=1 Tax=Methylobacterium mesophilicum SR1.6/6 TaxID=908290 RepID=A0A6B9FU74_9HYPH|nr:hypothetical protein MMSR116_11060 [Methylobacterium mesophilicum SR1.6/6]
MHFPPFIPAEVVMARAVMPADHHVRPEPMSAERAARALYDAGHRAIMASASDRDLSIAIVRAFPPTERFGDALNTRSAMQAVRYHLQQICAAAQADKLDPEHLDAVKRETARCARQMGDKPAAEAAE